MRSVQRKLEEHFTGRDIIDKARKHGISTHVLCRFYAKVTTEPNSVAATVAHKPDSTQALWDIVHFLHRNDPRKPHVRYSSRKELYFDQINSRFIVLQAGEGSGRAHTINFLHLSELAQWQREVPDVLAGLIGAVPPLALGSEIVIESTARGKANEFHHRYQAAQAGESGYTAHFFPWFEHPEYVGPWTPDMESPTDEELELMQRHGLKREQIAFRRSMISDIGSRLFRQEYPATAEESFEAKDAGTKFQRDWFETVDAVPAECQWVRYWDLAGTEASEGTDPDWTAGCRMGRSPESGLYFIQDMRNVRRRPAEVEALVRNTASQDGIETTIVIEQEPGASGKSVVDYYIRMLAGYVTRGDKVTGKKELRADPYSSQADAGNVKLVCGPWIDRFLEEHEAFPNGQHDDQVDAAAGAFSELTLGEQPFAFA